MFLWASVRRAAGKLHRKIGTAAICLAAGVGKVHSAAFNMPVTERLRCMVGGDGNGTGTRRQRWKRGKMRSCLNEWMAACRKKEIVTVFIKAACRSGLRRKVENTGCLFWYSADGVLIRDVLWVNRDEEFRCNTVCAYGGKSRIATKNRVPPPVLFKL